MIYKYWVLNIQIINSDYIDEDRSEEELDNATGLDWRTIIGLVPLGGGPVVGVECRGESYWGLDAVR